MKKIEELLIADKSKIKNDKLKDNLESIVIDYKALKSDDREEFLTDNKENVEKLYALILKYSPEALEQEKKDSPNVLKKIKEAKKGMSKKMTKTDVDKCHSLISEMRSLLNKHSDKPAKPKHHKKVSTLVADNLFRSISSPIRKEMTTTKVSVIKVDKLKAANSSFVDGLKSLRQALGGISDNNDQFIKRFVDSMNELIKEITEKQKQK